MTAATVRAATLADAAAIGRIQVATWRNAYAGIVPKAYLDNLAEASNAQSWQRGIANAQRTIVVAQSQADVSGFACGGMPARDPQSGADAELDAIYVLPEQQRRGTGRRLVSAIAGAISRAGGQSMVVWVLTANQPARTFYERLGAVRLSATKQIDFGWDLPIEEMAYRWDDVAVLLP